MPLLPVRGMFRPLSAGLFLMLSGVSPCGDLPDDFALVQIDRRDAPYGGLMSGRPRTVRPPPPPSPPPAARAARRGRALARRRSPLSAATRQSLRQPSAARPAAALPWMNAMSDSLAVRRRHEAERAIELLCEYT